MLIANLLQNRILFSFCDSIVDDEVKAVLHIYRPFITYQKFVIVTQIVFVFEEMPKIARTNLGIYCRFTSRKLDYMPYAVLAKQQIQTAFCVSVQQFGFFDVVVGPKRGHHLRHRHGLPLTIKQICEHFFRFRQRKLDAFAVYFQIEHAESLSEYFAFGILTFLYATYNIVQFFFGIRFIAESDDVVTEFFPNRLFVLNVTGYEHDFCF